MLILIVSLVVLLCVPIAVCVNCMLSDRRYRPFQSKETSKSYSQVPKEYMYDEPDDGEKITIIGTAGVAEEKEDMKVRYSENVLVQVKPVHEVMAPLAPTNIDSDNEVMESMVQGIPKLGNQSNDLAHINWSQYAPVYDTTTIRMHPDDDETTSSSLTSDEKD